MADFTFVLCPDPLETSMVEYERGNSIKHTSDDDPLMSYVEVKVCPTGAICTDFNVIVELCPVGEECECNYDLTDLQWWDDSNCRIYVAWTNPDKCVLKTVKLGYRSGFDGSTQLAYQYDAPTADPGDMIYENDDTRNPNCPGCGIGGDNEHPAGKEEVSFVQNITPGQFYRVSGYFNDDSCGGVTREIVLGYILYETTGWTSGRIVSLDDEATRLYTVDIYNADNYGNLVTERHQIYASDFYNYSAGDGVMIAKRDTEFPGENNIYGEVDVTNNNVERYGATDRTVRQRRESEVVAEGLRKWNIVAYSQVSS